MKFWKDVNMYPVRLGNITIILEESMEYTSINEGKNGKGVNK